MAMESKLRQWQQEHGLSPQTMRKWGPLVETMPALDTLTEDQLVAWVLGVDHAPNTMRGRKQVARSFVGWAYGRHLTQVDPVIALARVRIRGGNVRPGRWLTRPEAVALLGGYQDTPNGQRDRILVGLMLLTGLRASEALALTWGDRVGQALHIVGKRRKVRLVPVPDQAHRWLNEWCAYTGTQPPTWPMFPSGNGAPSYSFTWDRPLTLKTLATNLAEAAARAGIGHVTPHDLRRSFAGWLDEDGADLRSIQAALRHDSAATTERHYLQASPGRAERAVRQLRL